MKQSELQILLREGEGSMLKYLHRVVFIEKAGTGIRRIIEDTREHHCPDPKFGANGFFTATFWPTTEQVTEQVGEQVTPQVASQVPGQVTGQVADQVATMLRAAYEPHTLRELQDMAGSNIGLTS
jgi:ATP-dependent DNA helicase RecG